MNRKLELSFPASVLAMLLVLALMVGPIATGGEGGVAVKAALFLIAEILLLLVIRAAMKAHGSHGRLTFRKALSEITEWKMPLWFPVGIAGIILTAYVSAALNLGGWGYLLLFLSMTIALVYLFSGGPRSLWRATKTVIGFGSNLVRGFSLLGLGVLGLAAVVVIPLLLLYLFIRFVKWAWVG